MSRERSRAVETLFYPFETGSLDVPQTGAKALFLNAQYHAALDRFDAVLQQHFKPDADVLKAHDFTVSPDIPDGGAAYDFVFVLLPKNVTEAAYLAARGLSALKSGGVFVCAADNDAGGGRIKGMLQAFGVCNVRIESKHKARVAWFEKAAFDAGAVFAAIDAGAVQPVLDGEFFSQPGVFGWNKIDTGSALLAQHIPYDLSGAVADFGCGYGYLSRFILQQCHGVRSLTCIDADARALECAKQNLLSSCGLTAGSLDHRKDPAIKLQDDNIEINYLWADLISAKPFGLFDTIIMNPPFHAGKVTDSDIGAAFIKTAAASLRQGGALWMVANAGLPYEGVLHDYFKDVYKIVESQGFKVFRAGLSLSCGN
ncbi:MAG: class I SAM-dependent methyltransferase [Bdellovibrionales bacterium]